MGGVVELLQSEVSNALEHGKKPALYLAPKGLLLSIGLGCGLHLSQANQNDFSPLLIRFTPGAASGLSGMSCGDLGDNGGFITLLQNGK